MLLLQQIVYFVYLCSLSDESRSDLTVASSLDFVHYLLRKLTVLSALVACLCMQTPVSFAAFHLQHFSTSVKELLQELRKAVRSPLRFNERTCQNRKERENLLVQVVHALACCCQKRGSVDASSGNGMLFKELLLYAQ